MTDPTPSDTIEIHAPDIDVEQIVRTLRERVAENRRRGVYDDPAVARAERHNLLALQDDDAFMTRYLACLRHVVSVDINDFTIFERRSRFARLLVGLKTLIWKLLRFYTFRLWSQQNEINGVLLAAIEVGEQRSRRRIEALEARLAALENTRPANAQPSRNGPEEPD